MNCQEKEYFNFKSRLFKLNMSFKLQITTEAVKKNNITYETICMYV